MALSAEEHEALEHHKKMLRIRTRNLYILEEQEASYGSLNVPAHIISEIDKLTNQIEYHKKEIDQLERISVQSNTPINEVEFRVNIAEAWDTDTGYPTVVGRNRLEFARLRLHITVERAKELEHEVRIALAKERLYEQDVQEIREFLEDLTERSDILSDITSEEQVQADLTEEGDILSDDTSEEQIQKDDTSEEQIQKKVELIHEQLVNGFLLDIKDILRLDTLTVINWLCGDHMFFNTYGLRHLLSWERKYISNDDFRLFDNFLAELERIYDEHDKASLEEYKRNRIANKHTC